MSGVTLSKSRFIKGLECPQKLVYGQDTRYRNRSNEDSFLASLAEGGFQVGEFAKSQYPGGHDIVTLDAELAISQTQAYLDAGDCVIFEAAIKYQNCFIRVDVLEKKANRLIIHEVKAKSYSSKEDLPFLTKKGGLKSSWARYLYDAAFQKYVVQRAFPDSLATVNLMLIDKSSVSNIDGLNQCFKMVDRDGRRSAEQVQPIPACALDGGLLRSVSVDYECDLIYEKTQHGSQLHGTFPEIVKYLSDICAGLDSPDGVLHSGCGSCEFQRLGDDDPKLSGFNECIQRKAGITSPRAGGLIFDLWNNRGKTKQLASGAIRLTDITAEDLYFPETPQDGSPLTTTQRQWLQIEKFREDDPKPYIDTTSVSEEMRGWEYPYHFIDFETTRVALPFFKDQTPYHNVAFQFSHHVLDADGAVRHANQFLLAKPGVNPNSHFVRALQDALAHEKGTVFMYSKHENSTLRAIHDDLDREVEPDGKELQAFIETLVTPSDDSTNKWQPSRPMVDLLRLVKDYIYLPATNGSNSLKAVLPAVLNSSNYLKSKYSEAIYGIGCEIPSLNIGKTAWIGYDHSGAVINPYSLLPDIGADLPIGERDDLAGLIKINEGGAALTAYGRLMFEELADDTRLAIERALLKYCELDTFAMVLLYQGIADLVSSHVAE